MTTVLPKFHLYFCAAFGIFFTLLACHQTVYGEGANECPQSFASDPIKAGLAQLLISAPCRKMQKVRLKYDFVELVRQLDEDGALEMIFDCFLGDKPFVTVMFEDGSSFNLPLQPFDLKRITKIAVIWKGPINFDVHAFEYAASANSAGDIWAGNPSDRWSVDAAIRRDNRGHGFMSFLSDGSAEGDQIEVYTFIHEPSQKTGLIKMALDYESRARSPQDPDTCGSGLYADTEFKVIMLSPNGQIARSSGSLAPIDCNKALALSDRYNSKVMPQIYITPMREK